MNLKRIQKFLLLHMHDADLKEIDSLKLLGKHKLSPFGDICYILSGKDTLNGWAFYHSRGNPIVIIFNEYLLKPSNFKHKEIKSQLIGTIAHESLHIVTAVLKAQNITNIHESEELFCYLLDYLTRAIFEIVWGK